MMDIRDKILCKAHELFVKEGIRSVTMDRLAQSLGMSKRTIYEHFKDKDELVREDVLIFSFKINDVVERVINESENVIASVPHILCFMQDVTLKVNPTYFLDIEKYYSHVLVDFFEKANLRDFKVTKTFVEKGMSQGLFKSAINVELVSSFINKIVFDFHREVTLKGGLKAGEFERDVLFAYYYGIATDKGCKVVELELNKYLEQLTVVSSCYKNEIYKF